MQVGLITTWSGYNAFRKCHPEQPDPLEQFKEAFRKAAGLASDDEHFTAVYPLFLVLCDPLQHNTQ